MANLTNPPKSQCCTSCNKQIQNNNLKRILCPVCERWRHLKCTPFNSADVNIICPLCVINIFPFSHIESDIDFYSAVLAKDTNCLIDHQLLNTVKFELKCDFSSSTIIADDETDADVNYYNVLFNNPVKYCETAILNNISPQAINTVPQFLMHINARSLLKNINNLITELRSVI